MENIELSLKNRFPLSTTTWPPKTTLHEGPFSILDVKNQFKRLAEIHPATRLRAPQPFNVFPHRVRDGHELSILPHRSGRDTNSFRDYKQEGDQFEELMSKIHLSTNTYELYMYVCM